MNDYDLGFDDLEDLDLDPGRFAGAPTGFDTVDAVEAAFREVVDEALAPGSEL